MDFKGRGFLLVFSKFIIINYGFILYENVKLKKMESEGFIVNVLNNIGFLCQVF